MNHCLSHSEEHFSSWFWETKHTHITKKGFPCSSNLLVHNSSLNGWSLFPPGSSLWRPPELLVWPSSRRSLRRKPPSCNEKSWTSRTWPRAEDYPWVVRLIRAASGFKRPDRRRRSVLHWNHEIWLISTTKKSVLLIVICLYGWFLAERVNNWPPVPRICPIKPCFYQDFEEDIPEQYRKICIRMYYLWVCTYYTAPIELCSFHVRWSYLVLTFSVYVYLLYIAYFQFHFIGTFMYPYIYIV